MFTKRRQKQLTAIKARRAKKKIPTDSVKRLDDPVVRDLIAEAVHKAVCEFTDSDGFGFCMLYSIAGMGLLGRVFEHKLYPQAGSMGVLIDPPDYWMVMDGEDFQPNVGGEFHCWLGGPSNDGGVELIDFSARHYKRYCGGLIDVTDFDVVSPGLYVRRDSPVETHKPMTWNREDPPAYLWLGKILPNWLTLKPIRRVTEAVWIKMQQNKEECNRLIDLAVNHLNSSGTIGTRFNTTELDAAEEDFQS